MSDLTKSGIKIFNAHAKLGTRPLTAEELAEFLGTPELLVRLGTIDQKGEPDDVRPTWYYFDSSKDRLYIGTNKKLSKMIRNLEKNKIISFCIDDSRPDRYKGVRGKGDVYIHEYVEYTAPIFKNIAARYVQADENYLRETKKGDYVILEIKPRYYSTWTIINGGGL
jgi:general stress protein 26